MMIRKPKTNTPSDIGLPSLICSAYSMEINPVDLFKLIKYVYKRVAKSTRGKLIFWGITLGIIALIIALVAIFKPNLD